MKRIVVIVLIIIICFFVYSIVFQTKEEEPPQVYRFDFDDLDRDFWLVSPWEEYKRAYDLVEVKNGVLKLSADVLGQIPFMLSKPLEIRIGDVITMKRRIKINHGEGSFSGGMGMYQTSDIDLIPEKTDGSWFTSMGDGIFLVEYSYDLAPDSIRPGKDVIRFLAADWEYNDNYALITPIYDEWYEETFIFDMRLSQMTYIINDKPYKLNSYKLDRSAIRFLMHPFGTGTGNSMEIDYVEITIENKQFKRSR